jgi:hypothetical protein
MKKNIAWNHGLGALRKFFGIPVLSVVLFSLGVNVQALENGNPLVTNIYTADASAHEYEGRVYVYGSHDKDTATNYDMEDYHVLSSADLVNWVDHGVVLHKDDVPWVSSRMWAPDCAYKNGTYYLYFPARDKTRKPRIGVATSSSPAGPFVPEDTYIEGTDEIDPAVFVDDDGQAYLYWGGHRAKVAKLDATMKKIDGDVVELPSVKYYYEGPWMHKKDGVYYLSYSEGGKSPGAAGHLIVYSTSTSPMGPFTYQGVVNDNVLGITNHGSTLKRKGQWYYFYHNSKLSGGNNYRRSIVADYMHHNDDGSIRPVIQTDLGIGQYNGLFKIEAENYTETENVEQREGPEDGLHVVFDPGDQLVFTQVDLEDQITTNVFLRVASTCSSGHLEIRTTGDQLLGSLPIPNTGGSDVWVTVSNRIAQLSGRNNISLTFVNTEASPMCLDWIDFGGQKEASIEAPVAAEVTQGLNGVASQSSTRYGGIASRAVDGNTQGGWDAESVTHTAAEAQPWWERDLGDSFAIGKIVVWGRTDASYKARLRDYDVTLLDSSRSPVWSSYQADCPDPSVALNPNGAIGRYVRVQLRGTEALSLAEVQVFETSGTPIGLVVAGSPEKGREPVGSDAPATPVSLVAEKPLDNGRGPVVSDGSNTPAGLVAQWSMDDGSGTVVRDGSGNGFDGTLSGGTWVKGRHGGALKFNGQGSSDSVAIPKEVFGSIRDEVSIAFWAYGDTDRRPLTCAVFGATDAGGTRLLNIQLTWKSSVYWDAGNSDGNDRVNKRAVDSEVAGQWNHWVFTKNAGAGTMSIYLNGTLWQSASGRTKAMTGVVANACFGSGVNADYYSGTLDDVRIYNVELTAAEASTLFHATGQ